MSKVSASVALVFFAVANADICDSTHELDCYGDDLQDGYVPYIYTHMDCCDACKNRGGCNAWTWNWKASTCYLKSACSNRQTNADCHSGTRDSPGPSPPTPGPSPSPPSPPSPLPCLCLFDIDRTLTGRQDSSASCPMDQPHPGIYDPAYGGGDLVLSEAAVNLDQTFCRDCYIGTISAGSPGASEKVVLHATLSSGGHLPTNTWNAPGCYNTGSPLVTQCQDHHKQTAVAGIQQWYKQSQGVDIADQDVYFYGDRPDNIDYFSTYSHKYNAHEISCGSRDGYIGKCGARTSEIRKVTGFSWCDGHQNDFNQTLGILV